MQARSDRSLSVRLPESGGRCKKGGKADHNAADALWPVTVSQIKSSSLELLLSKNKRPFLRMEESGVANKTFRDV